MSIPYFCLKHSDSNPFLYFFFFFSLSLDMTDFKHFRIACESYIANAVCIKCIKWINIKLHIWSNRQNRNNISAKWPFFSRGNFRRTISIVRIGVIRSTAKFNWLHAKIAHFHIACSSLKCLSKNKTTFLTWPSSTQHFANKPSARLNDIWWFVVTSARGK